MNIKINAYGKLNLTLEVTGKRADGYHTLRSIMQTVGIHDIIEIEAEVSDDNQQHIEVSCRNREKYPDIKWDETNLVYKAAELIMAEFGNRTVAKYSISITVTKNIPAGAGMAGGSADAAAVLRGLNSLLNMGFSREKLCELGVKLGADIPFCVTGGTVLCEGIGEKLTILPKAKNIYCVILKPEASISTKYIYEQVDSYIANKDTAEKELPDTESYESIVSKLSNMLEAPAEELCKEVTELKAALIKAGADNALMTGSGSAVFALFRNEIEARLVLTRLRSMLGNDIEKYLTKFY